MNTHTMTVIELKEKLIARINDIDDVRILKHWEEMMEDAQGEDIYILSEAERAAINEGMEQIKQGEYLDEDEANRQIEEWLKK